MSQGAGDAQLPFRGPTDERGEEVKLESFHADDKRLGAMATT